MRILLKLNELLEWVDKADADIGYWVEHEIRIMLEACVDLVVPSNHKDTKQKKKTAEARRINE